MADNKYKSRFERSAKSMSEECVKNDIIGNQKDYRKSDLTVVKIPLDNLVEYTDKDFENMAGRAQPFMAYTEDALKDLADSISNYGVMQPISVRPYGDKYQIIAGRNRTRASKLAGKTTIPAIIYPNLDDLQAAVIMLDTNLKQRRNLKYSELAFAYRMRMELLNRRGRRCDLNHTDQVDSLSEMGKKNSQSRRTVAYLIRLTYLIPELVQRVDDESIGFLVGVQLSYLNPDIQRMILNTLLIKGEKITKGMVQDIQEIEKNRPVTEKDICKLIVKKRLPQSITFSGKRLEKYSDIIENKKDIERLFFEFLDSYQKTKCNCCTK